ncbi:SNO glutamine amidotransferase [Artomyces pyxidatus]|uniref:SNO glutamine amidotransferase n=1 Tax=Artomyces pyxidatus TaxID=48021 RepID=A0ACB8TGH6_9AGAM|nr:SNO glutamine amidotransferase [Artomyces pyxidatus]
MVIRLPELGLSLKPPVFRVQPLLPLYFHLPIPSMSTTGITIGILALQGAVAEHQRMLQTLKFSGRGKIHVVQVRMPDDLAICDALIIPGGESTTIALLAKLSGLLEPLREFVKTKVVWGTCAGAILLSQSVSNAKQGGQELLGGISVRIARNGWGSQVESFEAPLEVTGLRNSSVPYTGIFIRAPVILSLRASPGEPPVEVISRVPPELLPQAVMEDGPDQDVVALRQGRHLLTTFHPELTNDNRFHEYFVQECVIPSIKS